MTVTPFILVPLYIYPNTNAWQPLFDAASANPGVNFTAVVNPWDGPGSGKCPDTNFISAIATLNSYSNVNTLGYVHTANKWNCGSTGSDICPCTQPIANVQANITKYANWPTASCSKNNAKDIHMDGIFFDESPTDSSCLSYMQSAVSFEKSKMTKGNIALFNSGWTVDASYFGVADYINVFEDSESTFQNTDIRTMTSNGAYRSQSTLIVNQNSGGISMKNDVHMMVSANHNNVAGIYVTDGDYDAFPSNFTGMIAEVVAAIAANKS